MRRRDKRCVAGHAAPLDREPRFVLDRALVRIGHADAVRGHVVHEEIREVLGGDDDQRIGLRGFEALLQLAELRVERVANARLGARCAARDTRCVAADAGEHEAHRDRSFSML